MSETDLKVATSGKPQMAETPPAFMQPVNKAEQDNNGEDAAAKAAADAAAAGSGAADNQNEEALIKMLGEKGIKLGEGGFEELKQKLESAGAGGSVAKSEEQLKAEAAAFEKRMLDHFTGNGGTVENFVALKQIAATDLTELSQYEIKKEMKENGFSDEEIDVVLKERYYQLNPEEIQQDENESLADFEKRKSLLEKKIAYGAKKLAAKSSYIKKKAEDGLNALKEAIKTEDLLKEQEAKMSSKVDDIAAKLPRKLTFELGSEENKIDPVHYNVSDDDVAEIVAVLKDPQKRQQFFFNQDNSLNLENVAGVMLRNKYLESALKAVYTESADRQVKVFENTFGGRKAADVGVGGNKGGGANANKGVVSSAGKPQVAVR